MMSIICKTCASIKYRDLPSRPESMTIFTPEGPNRNIFAGRLSESDGDEVKDFFRWDHHESLEVLAGSAAHCPLCMMLLKERQKLEDILEDAMKDEQYSYYDRMKGLSDEPMKITKRLDGGDGFLVIARAKVPDFWYYVAGVGFCVDEHDPLSMTFLGRPLATNSGDTRGMNQIASWVQICDREHTGCENHTEAEMPLRVLDLGSSDDADVKLIETGGMRAPYATLSHCWGNTGHFTTTKSSLAERQNRIDQNSLPKTFKDAISITRRLGVRYIWIDSLCIMQDDAADWERESARMAFVYSNSYITIAATGAKDNSVGCFGLHEREYHDFTYQDDDGTVGTIRAFLLPLREAYFANAWLEMRDEPLSERGWTLQERALAPRIIHYASDQIYFECDSGFSSEDGVKINGRMGPYGQYVDGKFRREDIEGAKGWSNIIWSFTMRKLSKPQDRLPALSGLARNYKDLLQDDYVAGMWRKHLLQGGLLWQAVGGKEKCKPAQIYRGPSWSWASIDGLVGVRERSDQKSFALATILDLHIELKGQNPFGEVSDGWLKIKGPKMRLRISDEPEKDAGEVPYARAARMTVEGGDTYGTYCLLDTLDTSDPVEVANLRGMDIFLLALIKYSYGDEPYASSSGEEEVEYQGLIITQSEDGSENFRRLGVLSFGEELLGTVDVVEGPRHVCELTLV